MNTWLRAPSSRVQTILLLASGLVFLLSRTAWTAELDWALNWALGCTILMGPATAGLASWSVARDYPRSMQRLSRTFRRGDRYPLHLVLRTWVCAVAAWGVCVLLAATIALVTGSTRISLVALALLNGPAVLAACAGLGALVSAVLRSVAAAPISAGLVYVIALTSSRAWTSRALWDGGATAPLRSLDLNPEVLVASIVLNTAIAVTLLASTMLFTSFRTAVGRPATILVGIVVAIFALVVPNGQTYYTSATAQSDHSTGALSVHHADAGVGADRAATLALPEADQRFHDVEYITIPAGSTTIAVDIG